MDMRTRIILMWSGVAVLVVGGIAMLFLAFGGSKESTEVDVNAIYTNAASTVMAQQQTLQAGVNSPTPISTLSLPTALPSPTLQQTPIPFPTIPPAAPAATACDVAVYVSDITIPDKTTVPAGQSFTKTWRVTNTGSCAWTATYQLVYVSGDSLGGKATAIGKAVNPGESADVSVVLTSSSAAGDITGSWRLSNDKGQTFGDSLTVVINSGVAAATVSATPTTEEDVVDPTATDFPTETPFPTETIAP